MLRYCLIALLATAPLAPAMAQSPASTETLADLKQDLSGLLGSVQGLKRELSTTGASGGADLSGTSALARIDAMEAELQRLTSLAEELQFRINRVVEDGTNRIGDLQFRLCEIEPGCDLGAVGDTPKLGGAGGAAPGPAVAPQPSGGAQLAVGEQADFDRAKEALDSGSFRTAADLFATFAQTYTGGPLTGEAHYWRGRALSELGEPSEAARAYLESFSGSPEGTRAPDALLQLALKLAELDQPVDACATMGEVPMRFPGTEAALEAQTALASMGCS